MNRKMGFDGGLAAKQSIAANTWWRVEFGSVTANCGNQMLSSNSEGNTLPNGFSLLKKPTPPTQTV